jgi:hypothetical protein
MKPTDPPSPKASAGHGPPSHHHSPEELHNEGVAHEHSDINIRGIVSFAGGLAIVTAIVIVLMAGLFKMLESQAAARDPQISPLAAAPVPMPARTTGSPYFGGAPQPQLLTDEPALLQQIRQNEARQLEEGAWVDQTAGVARLPIDEAKKLIVERGLPVRAGAPVDPGLGTLRPSRGEASGGRILGTAAPQQGAAAPPKGDDRPPQTGKH